MSHAVKGNWGSAVKTSAGYNWRNARPNSNCNGGPTFIRTDYPLKNMVDRGIFDSGCSGHMTGNKDQLEDFEEICYLWSFDMKTPTPTKGFACLSHSDKEETEARVRKFHDLNPLVSLVQELITPSKTVNAS
ncbi:hypothetical protein Tco_0203179, partial [Tanacetum coccineum]